MLGFGAIGSFALGSVPSSVINAVLTAEVGAFVVAGQAALFGVSQLSSVGSYAVTGIVARLVPTIIGSPGSYIVTGNDSSYVSAARRALYLRGASYWKGSR